MRKDIIFPDLLQFNPASVKQLAVSMAKVGREYYKNLHDVVTNVYPQADV